jgi:hypothetical protein
MKKLIPLFALTAAILTACPPPPQVGTAIPTTGGTVNSSDSKASFVAPSAGSGTFVNVAPSSDQGQIPGGQTFVSAYNFVVTAGSVANATVNIQFAEAAAPAVSILKGNPVNRLYKRDGNFWRFVEGQTSTSTKVSAVVSSYGVYGVLSGVATIKDIVITPSSININLTNQAVTQQMTALVRDSLDQPMPNIDSSPVTWILESQTFSGAQPQAVLIMPGGNTISETGLFTARVAATDKIIATTNQNVTAKVPVTVTGSLPK